MVNFIGLEESSFFVLIENYHWRWKKTRSVSDEKWLVLMKRSKLVVWVFRVISENFNYELMRKMIQHLWPRSFPIHYLQNISIFFNHRMVGVRMNNEGRRKSEQKKTSPIEFVYKQKHEHGEKLVSWTAFDRMKSDVLIQWRNGGRRENGQLPISFWALPIEILFISIYLLMDWIANVGFCLFKSHSHSQ